MNKINTTKLTKQKKRKSISNLTKSLKKAKYSVEKSQIIEPTTKSNLFPNKHTPTNNLLISECKISDIEENELKFIYAVTTLAIIDDLIDELKINKLNETDFCIKFFKEIDKIVQNNSKTGFDQSTISLYQNGISDTDLTNILKENQIIEPDLQRISTNLKIELKWIKNFFKVKLYKDHYNYLPKRSDLNKGQNILGSWICSERFKYNHNDKFNPIKNYLLCQLDNEWNSKKIKKT